MSTCLSGEPRGLRLVWGRRRESGRAFEDVVPVVFGKGGDGGQPGRARSFAGRWHRRWGRRRNRSRRDSLGTTMREATGDWAEHRMWIRTKKRDAAESN